MAEKRKIIKFLLVLSIFIFAVSLRLWNIDKMGRTWDEDSQVELGYKFVKLIENKDLRIRIAKNGRSLVENYHSIEKSYITFKEIIFS
jgi:NADH:ubiquinone oxidoreductase subunit C